MPITFTYDIDDATVADMNDRGRITECFKRLGWEHLGGSAWRYPALGAVNASEDWFNHVIPALMYFRSIVRHAGITVPRFTLDAHSEAGYRGNISPGVGQAIQNSADITMYQVAQGEGALSESRLRRFIQDCSDSL